MNPTPEPRWRRRLVTFLTVIAIVALFIAALYQPWLAQWGSSESERRGAVVGDEIVNADLTWTRSITIDAPPEAIWPWIEQMGVDRGGFYNYDWGEQLVGDPVHNTTTIHPEWQDLEIGDAIHPFPGQDWRVTVLEADRALVLTNPAVTPTDWSWATELRPIANDRTRVVTRIRSEKGSVFSYVLDPPDLILFPRLLTGLKQRAEGTLPGMPGIDTGAPFPLARLPVHWWAAIAWLVGLAILAAAHRHASGDGGWTVRRPHPSSTFWIGFVVGAGYLLMSDTPPIHFVSHAWLAAPVLGITAGLFARRVLGSHSDEGRHLSRGISAIVETGLFILLPATIVWQAATARGWTGSLTSQVAVRAAALAAAALVGTVAWHRRGRAAPTAVFAAVVALPYVLSGSGLASLLAACMAELMPLRQVRPERSALSSAARRQSRPPAPQVTTALVVDASKRSLGAPSKAT